MNARAGPSTPQEPPSVTASEPPIAGHHAVRGLRRWLPLTIRARLILLVVAIFVPVVTAALWDLLVQYAHERSSIEQSVRETAHALSLVVDRELGKREIIARMLAASPYLDTADYASFYQQAKNATSGTRGWVVLSDGESQLVNTAVPFGTAIPARKPGEPRRYEFVTSGATVTHLAVGRLTNLAAASIQVPVNRGGKTLFNVGVTIRPEELQQILQEQGLPEGWIGAVLDRRGTLIARVPNPERWVGRPAPPEFMAAMARAPSGFLKSVSLEGMPVTAVYTTSPVYGWTFSIGIPRNQLGRSVERSLLDLVAIAIALLAISVVLATWFGRRIAGPIDQLRRTAHLLERNEPIDRESTGIRECDEVKVALADASTRIRSANAELERRVADAVATTEQVQVQLAAAQRLEALGRLTGGVAHDFNNLLAVINNNLFLLQGRIGASSASTELPAIRRAVNTGVRLTRQLLAFSRRQSIDPQRVQLREHLPAIAELIGSSLGGSIRLSLDIEPDVAPIHVDVAELELALINLAMNAKDAMPDGGDLRIRARNLPVDAKGDLSIGMVEIAVSDTGCGLPPEVLERAFEPFFTTKPAGQGTGLGLSQVYGFCAQAAGTARISSTPGKGTTVSLVLPASSDEAPEPEHVHRTFEEVRGIRVLLVDDNVDLMAATTPLLASFGFEVTTASSADEALHRLQEAPIDIVLSDVSMPGERNGLDLARAVRDQRPGLPVVLMTGYTSELQRAVSEGFKVLQKPCAPDTLAAVLQEAYAMRRASLSQW